MEVRGVFRKWLKKKTISLESPTKVEGDNFGKLWPDYEVYPMPG